ncbi:hypothetical protein ACFCV3_02690 [Kribbella sp. NPDC056345]|uniref:hypothetical protein n=1 Tax=Kribbella sp. NPDC056345 TaxID=3345789 RepID=UPI0035DFF4B6
MQARTIIGTACLASAVLLTSACSTTAPEAKGSTDSNGGISKGDRAAFCAEAEKSLDEAVKELADDETTTDEQDLARFKDKSARLLAVAPGDIKPLMQKIFEREVKARENGTLRELADDKDHEADGVKYFEQLSKTCPDLWKDRSPSPGK